jgi:hypothetical protein
MRYLIPILSLCAAIFFSVWAVQCTFRKLDWIPPLVIGVAWFVVFLLTWKKIDS